VSKALTSKIVSIQNLDTDVIFLLDTRMSGKHKVVEDLLRLKYKMYHNSFTNSRGVAILIRNNISHKILGEERDQICNVLALRIRIQQTELILGAVYGPNRDKFTTYDFLAGSIE